MISTGNDNRPERFYFDSEYPPYERRQELIDKLLDSFRKAKLDLLYWHLATRRNGGGESIAKKEVCLKSLGLLVDTCKTVINEIKSSNRRNKK